MAKLQQFCTFSLGEHFLGVPVESVQEVLRTAEITRVPLAARSVRGLINLRGQILTTIDLRRRLELPDREENSRTVHVVVRTADGSVTLMVDAMHDVLELDADGSTAPPETLDARLRRLIAGAYKLSDRLVLILDVEQTADLSDEFEVARSELTPERF